MGGMIEFQRPDGSACGGYFADAGPGTPAVVVIQEWWGLNAQICGVAERFAQAGYTALAPDLYHGRVTQNADEAKHLMDGLDFAGATHQDLRGAVDFLARRDNNGGGKIGVMGYCMGGALTIAAAVHVPGIAAASSYYGMPPAEFADPAKIAIPFQAHIGNQDAWITPALAQRVEQAMRAAGNAPEMHYYEADHAFCNERRPEVYNATCARLAWDRTLAFFARHLK